MKNILIYTLLLTLISPTAYMSQTVDDATIEQAWQAAYTAKQTYDQSLELLVKVRDYRNNRRKFQISSGIAVTSTALLAYGAYIARKGILRVRKIDPDFYSTTYSKFRRNKMDANPELAKAYQQERTGTALAMGNTVIAPLSTGAALSYFEENPSEFIKLLNSMGPNELAQFEAGLLSESEELHKDFMKKSLEYQKLITIKASKP